MQKTTAFKSMKDRPDFPCPRCVEQDHCRRDLLFVDCSTLDAYKKRRFEIIEKINKPMVECDDKKCEFNEDGFCGKFPMLRIRRMRHGVDEQSHHNVCECFKEKD